VGYYYSYPDPVALTGVTVEAVFFIIVAGGIAYFIERIRTSEIQYRTVFGHSQLGIVIFDRTGFTLRDVNEKFLDMLHYSADEIKSMTFPALFFSPREQERFFERINKESTIEDFETRFVTKEGDGCWVNLTWSRISDDIISCTVININKRKLVEKANNDNMMKYRQLTENSPTSILIIQDGRIMYSNPSFTQFSGLSAAELQNKDMVSYIDTRDQTKYAEFTQHWNKKIGKPENHEFRFVLKSGEIRVAALYATPIIHLGKPAMLINLMDISEKQRLEEKIQTDNERRRGIIITVAHELRTPLQPILGYLNLLIQDPAGFGIADDTKKILERCLLSVDRERQIINQMLELSVLESGKLHLNYSTFLLTNLVKSVLDTSGYYSKAEITVDIPDNLVVAADMDRLYSVIDSLLSNAINYSKHPRKIALFYCSEHDDTIHHISVRDNGIGIPPTAIDSIFEPFQLADAAVLSRKYDRIGLSLSIAKKIMLMHGGDITVVSAVNAGSTFTIHLPKEASHET
jgi:PAS domain S-box-containing protein